MPFQEHRISNLENDVENALISFIDELLPKTRMLIVTWFGGEPMLRIEQIMKLTNIFKMLCRNHGVFYTANIITNGTLLTDENIRILESISLRLLKISLDGVAQIHDMRRPLNAGGSSFDLIVQNLKNLSSAFSVRLRVNFDKQNYIYIPALICAMKQYGLKCKLSWEFAPICLTDDDIFKSQQRSLLFSTSEMAKVEADLYEIAMQEGYPTEKPWISKHLPCSAANIFDFNIDPEGYLYKCIMTLGDRKEAFGNLLTIKNAIDVLSKECKNFGFPSNSVCLNCFLLPLCMGGCKRKLKCSQEFSCRTIKFNYEKMLHMSHKYRFCR